MIYKEEVEEVTH